MSRVTSCLLSRAMSCAGVSRGQQATPVTATPRPCSSPHPPRPRLRRPLATESLKGRREKDFLNPGLRYAVSSSAPKSCIRRFVITEKAPTRAFSWLKAATTAFTFKTLLRHYAKQALTPRPLNVKLGPQRNYQKGRAAISYKTLC